MTASGYIVLGAAVAVFALLVGIVVVAMRRRSRARRDVIAAAPQSGWTPPDTPAPVDRLASASLEARIAAWVSTAPEEPVPVPVHAPPPEEPLPVSGAPDSGWLHETAVVVPPPTTPTAVELESVAVQPTPSAPAPAAPDAPEAERTPIPEPPAPPAPASASQQPESPAPAYADEASVAPVELWFDGTRVVVDSDDAASDRFIHFANQLLGDLARTRKPARNGDDATDA